MRIKRKITTLSSGLEKTHHLFGLVANEDDQACVKITRKREKEKEIDHN